MSDFWEELVHINIERNAFRDERDALKAERSIYQDGFNAARAEIASLRADWQTYLDTPHDVVTNLTARLATVEGERDGLRHLIETGHSRGAKISPSIRRIFSAGSKAAAERDALTLENERLKAAVEQARAILETCSAILLDVGQDALEDPIGHRHRKDDGGFYLVSISPIDRLHTQLAALTSAPGGGK